MRIALIVIGNSRRSNYLNGYNLRYGSGGGSGTDTDAIFVQGGITCGLLSLPIRYMHTTVEMTSLRDLNRIAHLFAGFALSMKPGEKFSGSL